MTASTPRKHTVNTIAKAKASVAASLKQSEELVKAFGPAPAQLPATSRAQLPATTASAAPAPAKDAQVTVVVPAVPGETHGRTIARKILKNDLGSALVMKELVYADPTLEVVDLCAVLREQGEKAEGGDLVKLEGTLAIQAIVLDGIFTNFARRAAKAKNTDDLERMLRIALKAQSQCRTTIESLAAVQNPTIFTRQQTNIAHGPQQVNNSAPRVRDEKLKRAKRTIERNQEDSDG